MVTAQALPAPPASDGTRSPSRYFFVFVSYFYFFFCFFYFLLSSFKYFSFGSFYSIPRGIYIKLVLLGKRKKETKQQQKFLTVA